MVGIQIGVKMALCPEGVYRVADKTEIRAMNSYYLWGTQEGTVSSTKRKREWQHDASFMA